MKRQFKMGKYAAARKTMAEYGFPLRIVMCGKVIDGRFYLTNRTRGV